MERAGAAGRSGEEGEARTDPSLMAVQKLLATLPGEGGSALEGAIEQAILRLAAQPSRERADALVSLLEHPEIGTPSSHPAVRDAAVRALVGMGFPYALEVPPEALSEAMRRRRSPGATVRRWLAFALLAPVWLASATLGAVQLAIMWSVPSLSALASAPLLVGVHLGIGAAGLGLLRTSKVKLNRWILLGSSLTALGVAVWLPSMVGVGVAGLIALAISPSHEGNVRGLD